MSIFSKNSPPDNSDDKIANEQLDDYSEPGDKRFISEDEQIDNASNILVPNSSNYIGGMVQL